MIYTTAVNRLCKAMEALPYTDPKTGEVEMLYLTKFGHDSPGLRELKRKIAHAIIDLIAQDIINAA